MKVRLPKSNGLGMGNLEQLAKKAQEAQKKMEEISEEIDKREFSATSGGEAVKVTVTGKLEVKSIDISKEVVDLEEIEILSDMIMAATNEAIKKASDEKNEAMKSISSEMQIPGLM